MYLVYLLKLSLLFSFDYGEILQVLKPLPDGSGNLLRIPRGMRITVGEVDFYVRLPC